jgi:hypothetical protein
MSLDPFAQAFAATQWDRYQAAPARTTSAPAATPAAVPPAKPASARSGLAAGDRTETVPARPNLFPEGSGGNAPEAEMSFSDFLDVVNPLQHLPLISTVYRKLTGDTITPSAQVMGDILYGGPLGGAISVVTAMIEQSGGQGPEEALYAALFGDEPAAGPAATETATADAAAMAPAPAAPAAQPPAAGPATNATTNAAAPAAAATPAPQTAQAAPAPQAARPAAANVPGTLPAGVMVPSRRFGGTTRPVVASPHAGHLRLAAQPAAAAPVGRQVAEATPPAVPAGFKPLAAPQAPDLRPLAAPQPPDRTPLAAPQPIRPAAPAPDAPVASTALPTAPTPTVQVRTTAMPTASAPTTPAPAAAARPDLGAAQAAILGGQSPDGLSELMMRNFEKYQQLHRTRPRSPTTRITG